MLNALRTGGATFVAIAALGCALPATAQPLEITVTEPAVIDTRPLAPAESVTLPSRLFDYRPNIGGQFDPGLAALDSQFLTRPGPSTNMVRAAVLDRNGVSLAQHQLRCQALHPSYEPVSDTYLGPDGLPRNCVY